MKKNVHMFLSVALPRFSSPRCPGCNLFLIFLAGLHTTMSFFMSTFFSAGLSGGLRRPPRCPSSCLRVGRVDASTRLACGTAERVGLVRSQDRNSESLSIEWVGLQPALDVGKGGSGLALRWPSGANTPHQRAQPGSPRTHTRHARHQTKGWPCWLYPTPWIPGTAMLALSNSVDSRLCGARGVACEGYPAARAARRAHPAGHLGGSPRARARGS